VEVHVISKVPKAGGRDLCNRNERRTWRRESTFAKTALFCLNNKYQVEREIKHPRHFQAAEVASQCDVQSSAARITQSQHLLVAVPLESLNGSKPNWRTLNASIKFPDIDCGGGLSFFCVEIGSLGNWGTFFCYWRGGGGNWVLGRDAENSVGGEASFFNHYIFALFLFFPSFLLSSVLYNGYLTTRQLQLLVGTSGSTEYPPPALRAVRTFLLSPVECRTIHHRFLDHTRGYQ
jgi:hypothetical protein